ncbi:unnamed protein product, partial [Aphanomyces euteiches]
MEVFQGREPSTIMDLLLDSEKKVVEAQVDSSKDNIQKTLFKLQERCNNFTKKSWSRTMRSKTKRENAQVNIQRATLTEATMSSGRVWMKRITQSYWSHG